jgi:hypothetical protein
VAISHVTKVFGVNDAKISKITADPAGGTTTYATAVDVPGIKSVTISGEINTVDLRGDHSLLDSDSTLQNISLNFEYAKLPLDALVVMLGGTVTDTGTTPSQVAKLALLGTDVLLANTWKFEARTVSADTVGGDVHFVLYKCRLASFPEMGTAEEDYLTFSVEGRCFPRLSDSKWIDVVLNETLAAIS